MCGIIGFYTKQQPTLKHKKLMEEGLLVDVLRGSCGTGVAGVTDDKKVSVYKKALAGPDFIQHDVFSRYGNKFNDYRIHLGHNRAATHGDARDEHAHPFHILPTSTTEDEIVLIHNGTIKNFNSLSPQGFFHQVDSAHIAAGMSAYGELKTLENLDGWFVLVWANVTKGTFNIAKGACRDIGIIQQDDDKGVLFASEFLMLNWLTERNGITTKANFLTPGEYEWWQWDMGDKKTTQFKKTPFKKFVYPTYINHSKRNRHGYDSDDDTLGYGNWPPTNLENKAKKDLEDLGFAIDEIIKFEVKGFVPYGQHNQQHGWVWGEETEYATAIKVKIHSITKTEYDEVFANPLITKSMTARAKSVERYNFQSTGPYILANVDLELAKLRIRTIEEDVKINSKAIDPPKSELCLITLKDGIKKESPAQLPTPANSSVFPHVERSANEEKSVIHLPTSALASIRAISLPGNDLRVPGPRQDYISLKEWHKLVEDGCAQCASPIQPRAFPDISWVGEMGNQALCHICSDELMTYNQSQKAGV